MHLYEGEEVVELKELNVDTVSLFLIHFFSSSLRFLPRETVTVEFAKKWEMMLQARLRCERQMLFRLPCVTSGGVVVRAYLYPLQDVKKEGNGSRLVEAIAGLKEGSSPGFHFYKRAAVWQGL